MHVYNAFYCTYCRGSCARCSMYLYDSLFLSLSRALSLSYLKVGEMLVTMVSVHLITITDTVQRRQWVTNVDVNFLTRRYCNENKHNISGT